jgi:hypothetical protein
VSLQLGTTTAADLDDRHRHHDGAANITKINGCPGATAAATTRDLKGVSRRLFHHDKICIFTVRNAELLYK